MYSKIYYESNKKSILKNNKKYYDNNKEIIALKDKQKRINNKNHYHNFEASYKRRYSVSKRAAIKRNIEFLLSFEEYVETINNNCYYCNNKLCQKSTTGIGLDRLDNNKGYLIINVVSCGKICNLIKNKFLTPEETKAAVEAILLVRFNKSLELQC